MCAQLEVGRADQIADVLDDQQVELGQIELFEGTVYHDRIQVAVTACINLNGG